MAREPAPPPDTQIDWSGVWFRLVTVVATGCIGYVLTWVALAFFLPGFVR